MGTRLEFNCSFPTSIPDSVRWKGGGQVGGGGVGGGGSPSFSWTTGTRNQFQSVNLFYWEYKNERFRQFNPTCMRYFLIHPKRSALFDLTF